MTGETAVTAKTVTPTRLERLSLLATLVALLVLSCLIGTISSYLALFAVLPITPLLLRSEASVAVGHQPALIVFIAVFVFFLVNSAATMRQAADIAFSLNFAPLLFAVPVYLATLRGDGRSILVQFSRLALAGAVVALLVGLVESQFLGVDRPAGLASNPNVFARLAILIGFLSCMGVLLDPRRAMLYLLGPLLGSGAAIMAESRGAVLAIPLLLAVLGTFLYPAARDRRKASGALVIGAGLAAVTVAAAWLGPSERLSQIGETIQHALAAGAGQDDPTQIRLDLYRSGIEAFRTAPWFGHGWANLLLAAADHAATEDIRATVLQHHHLHNDALDFAVAGGVLGFACWLAALSAPVLGAFAVPRDGLHRARLYGAFTLSVAVFVFGLTDMTLGYDILTTSYALFTAVILGCRDPGSTQTASDAPASGSVPPPEPLR